MFCPILNKDCIENKCAWWVKVITWTYPDESHDYECYCSVKAIAIRESE